MRGGDVRSSEVPERAETRTGRPRSASGPSTRPCWRDHTRGILGALRRRCPWTVIADEIPVPHRRGRWRSSHSSVPIQRHPAHVMSPSREVRSIPLSGR